MTERDGPAAGPSVAILADDLIWATRLADGVTKAGGTPVRTRRLSDLEGLLERNEAGRVLIDLTARAYDGIGAIAAATGARARVIAVGQHDDVALRKRALAAGAERVFTYRQLFEAGPSKLRAWLESAAPERIAR